MILRWGYMPNEVAQALQPLIRQYLWLVPGWCQTLTVRYTVLPGDKNPHSEAAVWVSDQYRRVEICFYATWLDDNPSRRRETVIHELLHVVQQVTAGEHERTLGRLLDDDAAPKFKATLNENWVRAVEMQNQDLTFAILRISEGALPVRSDVVEDEDEQPPVTD